MNGIYQDFLENVILVNLSYCPALSHPVLVIFSRMTISLMLGHSHSRKTQLSKLGEEFKLF